MLRRRGGLFAPELGGHFDRFFQLSLKMGLLNPVPYYVVVSDEKGNILNTATFNSNETKNIIPKEPCEVKSINIVYYYTWFQSTTMAAFIHVKRGSELKLGTFETNVVKSIKLHFKNDLTNFVQLDIGTDLSRYILTSMADTTRNLPATFPYTGDHKLLLQVQTTTGRYYKLFTIKDIESLTVNLSSINILETKKSQIFPLTGNVFYIITAKTSNDDPLYQYYLSSGTKEYNTNHIDLFYPATYFTKYQTLISHSLLDGSNKIYSNISSGAVPETFSYISAGAQITSSSLTGFKTVFSGTFDHYLAIYRILSQSVVLNVNAPANQNEWILPDLGTAFGNSALNSSNFFLYQLQLKDYQSLNLANNYYALDIERLVAAEDHIQNLTYQVRTK